VTFKARDRDGADGATFLSITATVTDAANGDCTVQFVTPATVPVTAGEQIQGKWTLALVNDTNDTRYTKYGQFELTRNWFI
jgi:hypothetical protein